MINFTLTAENAATEDRTDRGMECAAWWQDWKAQPGVYPLEVCAKPDFWNSVYFTVIDEVSGPGNYQSMFGGNAVGKAYDTSKEVGKMGKSKRQFTPYQLLTDSRVTIEGEDEYELVLQAAVVELEKAFQWAKDQLDDDLVRAPQFTRIGKPMIPTFHYDEVSKQARRLYRVYSCINSRSQRGYEGTRINQK